MAMKPFTSESIDLEIAQTAELSLADATDLPVEICDCVSCRFAFTDFRVCSATMALVLVRMLDMKPFPLLVRRRFRAKVHRVR
jgi:flagellar hook protein FlgE